MRVSRALYRHIISIPWRLVSVGAVVLHLQRRFMNTTVKGQQREVWNFALKRCKKWYFFMKHLNNVASTPGRYFKMPYTVAARLVLSII